MKAALWFRRVLLLCVFILVFPISKKAEAGSPIEGHIIISEGTEQEVSPAIAYNSQRQEYLVVWYNDRPGCDDIRAQRISASGQLTGSPFYISYGCDLDRRYPDVIYNSTHDQYLVVWEQHDPTYTWYSIQGRRISGTGALLDSSDITIRSASAQYASFKPAVAYASYSDRYLVVWAETCHPTPTTYDIYGQVMTHTGALDGSPFSISSGTESRNEPDLAYNRHANRYLVVWHQVDTSVDYIYGQQVHGYGGLYQSNLVILFDFDPIISLAIAAQPTSPNEIKFRVAYEGLYNTSTHAIWNCLVKEDGVLVSCFSSIPVDNDTNPAVAASESNLQYLVVWRRTFQGSGNSLILSKDFNFDCNENYEVSEFLGDNADLPAVAAGPAGDFLVVWQDQPVGATDTNIYGQLWGLRMYLPQVIH